MPTGDRDATTSSNQDTPGHKKKSKKDKIRSAWISFVGRIIAQIIGAAASILFGVLILHKYQGGVERPSKAHASQVEATDERPAPARARRSAGELALAVLCVVSRTTAMPYKRRQKTAVEIARELSASSFTSDVRLHTWKRELGSVVADLAPARVVSGSSRGAAAAACDASSHLAPS